MTEQEIKLAKANLEALINSELMCFTEETGQTVECIFTLVSKIGGSVYYEVDLEVEE